MIFSRKVFVWLRAAAPLIVAFVAVIFAALPVSAKDVCRNWGQPSFVCPTSATRDVCGVSPNFWCFEDSGNADADLCSGETPSPRYRFSCTTCKCECDTANYPCAGCSVGTYTPGAQCGAINGGRYADSCGTCACPTGTVLCSTSNTCITAQPCGAGLVFDGCSQTCVVGSASAAATAPPPASTSGSQISTSSVKGDLYMSDGSSIRVDGISSTKLNVGNLQGGPFSLLVKGSLSPESLILGGVERKTWPSLKAVTAFKSLSPSLGKGWKVVDCPSGYVATGWSGYNCEENGGAWTCGKAAIYDTFIRVWFEASAKAYIWLRCLSIT